MGGMGSANVLMYNNNSLGIDNADRAENGKNPPLRKQLREAPQTYLCMGLEWQRHALAYNWLQTSWGTK